MEKLAHILTNYIIKKNVISKDSYEVYKYGFQTGMEILSCMAVSFFVAVWLNMTFECIVFFIVFILLRSYAGGLHLDSFASCFCCSCFVQIGTLLLTKYFQLYKNVSELIILSMILIIEVLEPVNNINCPLDEKTQKYFSKKLKYILGGIAIVSVVLFALRLNYYLSLIAIIMLVVVVSMILGKWKYKNEIKNYKKRNCNS